MALAGDTGVFLVGLTGGIGAGKSTVGRMLAEAGFPVIDTDKVGHEVLERPAVLVRVCSALERDVTDGSGKPDRKKIGDIVFADPDRRAALEEILHPEIQLEVKRRIVAVDASGRRDSRAAVVEAGRTVVVLEVPLLIEAGWDKFVDFVVVVDCLPDVQVARYAARTGASQGDGQGRVSAQAGREQRLDAADVVIDNSATLAELAVQVERLVERLRAVAGDRAVLVGGDDHVE